MTPETYEAAIEVRDLYWEMTNEVENEMDKFGRKLVDRCREIFFEIYPDQVVIQDKIKWDVNYYWLDLSIDIAVDFETADFVLKFCRTNNESESMTYRHIVITPKLLGKQGIEEYAQFFKQQELNKIRDDRPGKIRKLQAQIDELQAQIEAL